MTVSSELDGEDERSAENLEAAGLDGRVERRMAAEGFSGARERAALLGRK